MRYIISDILEALIALVLIGLFAVMFIIFFLAFLVAEFFSWIGQKIDNYLDKKASKLFDTPDE